MEFIMKKLLRLSTGEKWEYGRGFIALRVNAGWSIFKNGTHITTTSNLNTIAKEIQLTFIAMDITQTM